MPRKKIELTNKFPYHILARTNNKVPFPLPLDQCWIIFCNQLNQINIKFGFRIYAFVLMSNHYHLIGEFNGEEDLPSVMHWFQTSLNRAIHGASGKINHLFGGPYRASLISSEIYYYHCLRYIYQNPVRAAVVQRVLDYPFSSLGSSTIALSTPISGIAALVPEKKEDFFEYLKQPYTPEALKEVRRMSQRPVLKFRSRIVSQVIRELIDAPVRKKVRSAFR